MWNKISLFGGFVIGEKLAEEWDGNEVGLVAEVDCSSKLGKIFCEYMDIKSFPTLMYGHPNSMEEYEGGRTYQELSEFAKENLVPQCTPTDLDRCDAVTRELIEQYLAKSKQELMAMVKVEEAKLKEAKEKYDAELDALQAKYEEAAKVRDEAIEAVRKGGIHLMKAVVKTKVTPPTITAKKVTTEEL